MFYADKVAVEHGGVSCAYRKWDEEFQITLAWPPGHWEKFWAASRLDGDAVAIDSINQFRAVDKAAKKAAKKKGAREK